MEEDELKKLIASVGEKLGITIRWESGIQTVNAALLWVEIPYHSGGVSNSIRFRAKVPFDWRERKCKYSCNERDIVEYITQEFWNHQRDLTESFYRLFAEKDFMRG